MPTRFGGGGVVAEICRVLHKVPGSLGGGDSSRNVHSFLNRTVGGGRVTTDMFSGNSR